MEYITTTSAGLPHEVPSVTRTITPAVTPLTWPLREWRRQACLLYPHNPARQQRAILEHIQIAQHCTLNVERWLWLHDLAARVAEEGASHDHK